MVSSMAGIGFAPHASPEYAATKAAMCRVTASLAPLGDEHGIRVNCICPDWVETELIRERRLELGEEAWARRAPSRLISVDDVAAVAVAMIADERLAGRVLLCPVEGEWGLVPLDSMPSVEPSPGFRRPSA